MGLLTASDAGVACLLDIYVDFVVPMGAE